MKCVVINGTQVKGCTYHLKELFLNEVKPTHCTEFYLPMDAPGYCTGCKRCFTEHESLCPHFEKVEPIRKAMLEAELIVFAYPVYVMRSPGHVKSLLDHLGVNWLVHRPEPAMFHKTAVIITQSIGAPNGAAQKDVKTSLHWLGVPVVKRIGFGMIEGVLWDEISQERKQKFERKMRRFAQKFRSISPRKKTMRTKLYFSMCRKMQRDVLKKLPEGQKPYADSQYWIDQGWIKMK